MSMVWHDLLFMHWPVDPQQMREIVPEPMEVDLHDGRAWLGVVPFRMTGVRPRCVPAIPAAVGKPNPSSFLELNVRTYVRVGDKPGVFFFSLDAESKFAVRAARRFFHLPYFDARMSCVANDEGWFDYSSRRTHADAPAASCRVRYRAQPGTDPAPGEPGGLAHFLTERYCLYACKNEQVFRGEIHHAPWPLEEADVEIEQLDVTNSLGVDLSEPPYCCHFAKRLDVVAWLNRRA